MSDTVVGADPGYAAPREQPPSSIVGPWAWARANLFGSWWSTAVTLVLGYLILRLVFEIISWGLIHAVWEVPYNQQGVADTTACQNAKGIGACWAIIRDKYRLILFGRFPYDEQWRPAICVALFIGLYVVSAMRRFWRKELALIWIATLVGIFVLMWGGVLGHRGLLGRPAIDLDPRDIRPGLCLSACRAGRTWAPFDQAARSEVPLRVICGADPRRSSGRSPVYGQCDVPAVHARGRQYR
jgi:hypothetical protein